MNRLNKTESVIFVSLMCFLLPKDLPSQLTLASLRWCCVVWPYIFFCSFDIIGLILSQFENRVLLKPVLAGVGGHGQCCTITLLHMNRLNKIESAIFDSLMCFLLPRDLQSELICLSVCLGS